MQRFNPLSYNNEWNSWQEIWAKTSLNRGTSFGPNLNNTSLARGISFKTKVNNTCQTRGSVVRDIFFSCVILFTFTRLDYNSLKELNDPYTYYVSKKKIYNNIDDSSEKCVIIADNDSVDPFDNDGDGSDIVFHCFEKYHTVEDY